MEEHLCNTHSQGIININQQVGQLGGISNDDHDDCQRTIIFDRGRQDDNKSHRLTTSAWDTKFPEIPRSIITVIGSILKSLGLCPA